MERTKMMRKQALILLLLLFLGINTLAQQNGQNPYEIALQRIEEARLSGVRSLDLTHLNLSELPPKIGNLGNLQELHLGDNRKYLSVK
jgi:Leucine-rich repeat (LRR) protein